MWPVIQNHAHTLGAEEVTVTNANQHVETSKGETLTLEGGSQQGFECLWPVLLDQPVLIEKYFPYVALIKYKNGRLQHQVGLPYHAVLFQPVQSTSRPSAYVRICMAQTYHMPCRM